MNEQSVKTIFEIIMVFYKNKTQKTKTTIVTRIESEQKKISYTAEIMQMITHLQYTLPTRG